MGTLTVIAHRKSKKCFKSEGEKSSMHYVLGHLDKYRKSQVIYVLNRRGGLDSSHLKPFLRYPRLLRVSWNNHITDVKRTTHKIHKNKKTKYFSHTKKWKIWSTIALLQRKTAGQTETGCTEKPGSKPLNGEQECHLQSACSVSISSSNSVSYIQI